MVARGLGRVQRAAPPRGSRLTDGDASAPDREPAKTARSTVLQGDRLKAYRPIAPGRRREALDAGISAYERGDFFEAHELLEPAWMGTSDLAERALYQGLIKLAAGYVHAVRGNPIGFARNLRGARLHLETVDRLDPEVARKAGVDIALLLDLIDLRLKAATTVADDLTAARRPLIDLLPAPPPIR